MEPTIPEKPNVSFQQQTQAINKPIEEDKPKRWSINEKDFLPTQGKTPNHIRNSILEKIPIDKTFTEYTLIRGRSS